jgi:hypothetical protein
MALDGPVPVTAPPRRKLETQDKGGGDSFHETELSKVSFQSCFAACWPEAYQHHNHEQEDYGRDDCRHD